MHSSLCKIRFTYQTALRMLHACAKIAEALMFKLLHVRDLSPGAKAVQCCP